MRWLTYRNLVWLVALAIILGWAMEFERRHQVRHDAEDEAIRGLQEWVAEQ